MSYREAVAGALANGWSFAGLHAAGAAVRTVLVALLPLIAALGLLIAGIRFLGNNWSSAVVVLIGVSALSTVVWSGYRWWRRR